MTVIETATPKTTKRDVYAMVTDKIIDALEAGTVPWSQPWDSRIGMPVSMATSKPYRGINIWLLGFASMLGQYQSPWWGTYKKITELGGQVRKGEKSTMVTFWKTGTREEVKNGETTKKRWAILRFYNVFNAAQADDLPEKYTKAPEGHDHDPIESAQAILDGYFQRPGAPKFNATSLDGAYYFPPFDEVAVPPLAAFPQAEGFYSTVFHEATHSTGHKSRLAREGVKGGHFYGDEEYSKEELIAEMGAAMLCGVAGIDEVVRERSAAYLRSWITTLRGDVKLVVTAAGAAQRAADLILDVTFDNEEEGASNA